MEFSSNIDQSWSLDSQKENIQNWIDYLNVMKTLLWSIKSLSLSILSSTSNFLAVKGIPFPYRQTLTWSCSVSDP